jgi:hypothetical protein
MFRVWSARHSPLAQVAMAFGLGALLLILAFLQVHTLSGRPEQPQSRVDQIVFCALAIAETNDKRPAELVCRLSAGNVSSVLFISPTIF